jgi:membrane-bound ClpP family serine protease
MAGGRHYCARLTFGTKSKMWHFNTQGFEEDKMIFKIIGVVVMVAGFVYMGIGGLEYLIRGLILVGLGFVLYECG